MLIKDVSYELNDTHLILRTATADDAQILIDYLKTTAQETDYLISDTDDISFTLQDEIEFINRQNSSANKLMLLGFLNGKHVGNCSLDIKAANRCKHRASIGIALYQKYTRLGIGTIMMKKLIQIARDQNVEQIELDVMTENTAAISLYKKLGFKICATLKNNYKYKDGTYADAHLMIKKI